MLVKAYSKLNLCLEVLERRGDGYHEIRTVMQSIDLADDIEITPSTSLKVSCDDPALEAENNLAWKAVVEMAKGCGRLPLVDVEIKKHIPVGMGLGGGSSDAAAVILALNQLWNLGLPTARLVEIGAKLGSDVPFFIYGGAALASGRGQVIEPLPTRTGLGATLICPMETVDAKTGRMYGKLTRQHYSDGGMTQRLIQSIMLGHYSPDHFYNVFEGVAFQEFAGLEEIYTTVELTAGRRPHLTGAGPALFLFPSSELEQNLVGQALQPCGALAYFVRTVGREGKMPAISQGSL